MIVLVEALLVGKDPFKESIQTVSDYPGVDLLDLNTIVTILTSSKIPRLKETTTKPKNLVVKIKSELIKSQSTMSHVFSDYQRQNTDTADYTMESLVTQFLNQKFHSDNTVANSNNTSSMVSHSQASKFSDRSSALTNNQRDVIISPSKKDQTCSFLAKSPKEVFVHYTRPCFNLQNGLEVVLAHLDENANNFAAFRATYLDGLFSGKAQMVPGLTSQEALRISKK